MNDAVSAGLVPPRPNLGPEPWQAPEPMTRAYSALVVLVLLLIAALLWRRYRRHAARTRRDPGASGALPDANPTPRDRLVALSGSIRDALTVPFGNSCRAKTTEELAADSRLEQLLGDEELRELIRFLDQVDRLKFAPERSDGHQEVLADVLTSWEPRVEILQARIRARPKGRVKAGITIPPTKSSG
ncbi:MAG: hypothetical protein ACLQGP_36025 [Isosphaeraceae bacterium]